MVCVVIDSNVLLECLQLQDLPWLELFPAEAEIHIILVPMVIKEIDRHKTNSRKRLQKRARDAGVLFSKMLDCNGPLSLREKSPEVTIAFANETGHKVQGTGLELTIADHLILLQAIEFRDGHNHERTYLLTRDTNLRVAAKNIHFLCKIPPDNWFLSNDPDETEIENRQLKQRLDTLLRAEPKIDIVLSREGGTSPVRLTRYEALTGERVEAFVRKVASCYPMASFSDEPSKPLVDVSHRSVHSFWEIAGKQRRKPDPAQVIRYQEELYPEWLKALYEFFRTLHKRLEYPARLINFEAILTNLGTRPAEAAVANFIAKGAFKVYVKSKKETGLEEMPPPPKIPQGRHVSFLELARSYSPSLVAVPRYPHNMSRHLLSIPSPSPNDQFEWSSADIDKPSEQLDRACGLWRHQSEPEHVCFQGILARPPPGVATLNVGLTCRVHAKNLSCPAEQTLGIRVEVVPSDTEKKAIEIIENGFNLLLLEVDDAASV
ncbi:MAG: PIN domain-containing protein [Nevskia sp.]|jgi:hypothetical protein|nr:PIN domain-containing protein [Nevskia sp.]MCK9383057.1 PIN domain-containing protein [Nevskia sp.]